MIRIIYSNTEIEEYPSVDVARFMASTRLFTSHGQVFPVSAVEVFGHTSSGVVVERDLTIRLGMVEFDEVPRR